MQMVAYTSLLKITGISLQSMSRITPPKLAVMVPKIMHITGESPAFKPFSTPTIVYKPIPIVSKRNNDFLKYLKLFYKKNSGNDSGRNSNEIHWRRHPSHWCITN